MYVERHVVTLTTDAAGAATGYSPVLTGSIQAIHYVKTNFTDGVDFTITSEATGETIWTEDNVNAAKVCAPRHPTHSTAGVAALYAATFAVNDYVAIAKDRVKIVIAQGGDTKTGAFHIVVG